MPGVVANMTIGDVLASVKSGVFQGKDILSINRNIQAQSDHAIQNQLKQALPVFMPSGMFSQRNAMSLVPGSYTGIAVLDYDGFATQAEMDHVKGRLTATSEVAAVFVSPSGKGLKAVVVTDNANPQYHTEMMQSLFGRFKTPELDTSVKDISRCHYIPYDPNIYVNHTSTVYHFVHDPNFVAPTITTRGCCKNGSTSRLTISQIWQQTSTISVVQGKSDKSVINIINSRLQKDAFAKKIGHRNNSVFKYSCDLCKAGVDVYVALEYLKKEFVPVGLTDGDVEKNVIGGYSYNLADFGCNRSLFNSYGSKRKP